jgi:hypothetical protein
LRRASAYRICRQLATSGEILAGGPQAELHAKALERSRGGPAASPRRHGHAWIKESGGAAADDVVDARDQLGREVEGAVVDKLVEPSLDAATRVNEWGSFDPAVVLERIAIGNAMGQFGGRRFLDVSRLAKSRPAPLR